MKARHLTTCVVLVGAIWLIPAVALGDNCNRSLADCYASTGGAAAGAAAAGAVAAAAAAAAAGGVGTAGAFHDAAAASGPPEPGWRDRVADEISDFFEAQRQGLEDFWEGVTDLGEEIRTDVAEDIARDIQQGREATRQQSNESQRQQWEQSQSESERRQQEQEDVARRIEKMKQEKEKNSD
jgi:Skp family chaperone for outer membrane proteins